MGEILVPVLLAILYQMSAPGYLILIEKSGR